MAKPLVVDEFTVVVNQKMTTLIVKQKNKLSEEEMANHDVQTTDSEVAFQMRIG